MSCRSSSGGLGSSHVWFIYLVSYLLTITALFIKPYNAIYKVLVSQLTDLPFCVIDMSDDGKSFIYLYIFVNFCKLVLSAKNNQMFKTNGYKLLFDFH